MSDTTTEATTRRRNPETVAMDQIDKILAGLSDDKAELRVLTWVLMSRFPKCKLTADSTEVEPINGEE